MARNWLNFTETSGDHIVKQHVHNLDVAVWFIGRLPISAIGFGGRAHHQTGNMFDFFSVDLDFGDGLHIHSQCRQIEGTYQGVGEMFTGTEGMCYGGGKLTGKQVSVPEFKLDTDNSMIQEHIDMIRSAMEGKPLNDAKRIAEVSLVAIIGRMSAYTGDIIRMHDVLEKQDSPYYNYACTPTPLDFEKGTVKMPAEVPPVPGRSVCPPPQSLTAMITTRRSFMSLSAVGAAAAAALPGLAAAAPAAEPSKAVLRLSCQEGVAPGRNLAEKLDFLEANGFEGIEPGGRGLPGRVEEFQEGPRRPENQSERDLRGFPGRADFG